ncbi:MAG: hypothetical protein HY749_25130 [Gammaproteobacteria bacterium]|nr:hypothetical protein [Gammaproteobacteria bacterium]MBI5618611.1 hypothetical protein [Gammaproteobacteria bacterium]
MTTSSTRSARCSEHRYALLLLSLLTIGAAEAAPHRDRNPLASNGTVDDLPLASWVRLHVQEDGDAVRFPRQAHAGAAFDTRRGRLVLFGSDTHGEDWTNAPLYFDPETRRWSRPYANDPPSTYRVNAAGQAVTGPADDPHPWAMHTYGLVAYDPGRDRLVVASTPEHLEPGRFTNALAEVWPKVQRHPTWLLDFASGRWQPLAGDPIDLFPYAAAFDTNRGVLVGWRDDGVFELSFDPPRWQKRAGPGLTGYHNALVYDARHEVVLMFGASGGSDEVVVYDPRAASIRRQPTPGIRPPQGEHVPLAFHPRLGRMVALLDHPRGRDTSAETWLYDYYQDAWEQVPSATLPFALGMNYDLVYDPRHDALYLVTEGADAKTAVWALRL